MPVSFQAHKNFAYGTVASPPSGTNNTLTLQTGQGANFPTTFPVNATAAPPGVMPTAANSEIIQLGSVSGDQFTVTRAQEGSTQQSIAVGWQIYAGPTVLAFTNLEQNVILKPDTAGASRYLGLPNRGNIPSSTLASGWQKVSITSATFAGTSYFDVNTNHRYNVPYSGVYLCAAQASTSTSASNQAIGAAIYKNGSMYSEGSVVYSSAGSQYIAATVTDLIFCTAGDYLEFWVYSNAALSVSSGATTGYLSVIQVQ
jgi:hypothetical protein